MSHVMNTYARQPVAFVRGEGVWLWDEAGKKYLDALAGIAVNTLGYAHPRLTAALIERIQSGVIHTSNLLAHPRPGGGRRPRRRDHRPRRGVLLQLRASRRPRRRSRWRASTATTSGIAEPAIIVMEKAFHGRSLATLSATGSRKVQAGFEPLVQGFVRVPLNDLDAVRQVADAQPQRRRRC